MADHPLRSATDRRLGGPLPHQLANRTRTHPRPINLLPQPHARPWSYAVLAPFSGCYPPVWDRLFTRYSPVRRLLRTEVLCTLDLHVLSTPPAFVLSQDQTLMFNPHPSPKLLHSRTAIHSFSNLTVCSSYFSLYRFQGSAVVSLTTLMIIRYSDPFVNTFLCKEIEKLHPAVLTPPTKAERAHIRRHIIAI